MQYSDNKERDDDDDMMNHWRCHLPHGDYGHDDHDDDNDNAHHEEDDNNNDDADDYGDEKD